MDEHKVLKEFHTHMRVYNSSSNIFDLERAESCVFKLMDIKGFETFEQAYNYIFEGEK